MYGHFQGVIFDMSGTLQNTESTHCLARHWIPSLYGVIDAESAVVALNGFSSWHIALTLFQQHQDDRDPYYLAALKNQVVIIAIPFFVLIY